MTGTLLRGGLLATAAVAAAFAARQLTRPAPANLRGQVALVTGGSRGLGFLLARELAREGCRVAICARSEEELEAAAVKLRAEGAPHPAFEAPAGPAPPSAAAPGRAAPPLAAAPGRAEVMTARCDVSDRGQVEAMVDAVRARFGPVDVLVNNAGIIEIGPMTTMSHEDYQSAMDVMFWGVVNPTLAVLPDMRRRRAGRIVNITSVGGKVSVPQLLPYNCAKFAAVAFSEGAHAELARDGIKVTTVVPGLMRTGSHLHARLKSPQMFGMFALAASLPGLSMNAERAARDIVQAAKRGEAEVVLSLPAWALARFNGLFPGLTARLFAIVNRYALPAGPSQPTASRSGMEIRRERPSTLLDALTSLGLAAARRFNQLPGNGVR